MYALRSALIDCPVISLQTGQVVAWLKRPVLDIATLEVVALACRVPDSRQPRLIIAGDVRQYASDCVVIGSEDDLTHPDDIVRSNTSLKSYYSPLGKKVVSETGRKVGLVEDYVINLDTNRLQKLHVRKSVLHSWLGINLLLIDRTQITDVTPHRIVVREPTMSASLPADSQAAV
jgi:sporulation protein YlmC with PRC-barrel domain